MRFVLPSKPETSVNPFSTSVLCSFSFIKPEAKIPRVCVTGNVELKLQVPVGAPGHRDRDSGFQTAASTSSVLLDGRGGEWTVA